MGRLIFALGTSRIQSVHHLTLSSSLLPSVNRRQCRKQELAIQQISRSRLLKLLLPALRHVSAAVTSQSPSEAASYSWRTDTSYTPVREPKSTRIKIETVHNKSWIRQGFLCRGFVVQSNPAVLAVAVDWNTFSRKGNAYSTKLQCTTSKSIVALQDGTNCGQSR